MNTTKQNCFQFSLITIVIGDTEHDAPQQFIWFAKVERLGFLQDDFIGLPEHTCKKISRLVIYSHLFKPDDFLSLKLEVVHVCTLKS